MAVFDPMPQLQTGELELTGHMAPVLARCGEQIDAAGRQLCGFGLREIAAIAYDHAVCHPARERLEEFAISNRGRGQIKAAQPPGFVTLDMQLEAIPPPHPVLRFAGPVAKRPVLAHPRDVADGDALRSSSIAT